MQMTLAETIADDIMENYKSCEFTAQEFYKYLDGAHQNTIIQVLAGWCKKGYLVITGTYQYRKGSAIVRKYRLVKDAKIDIVGRRPLYIQSEKELDMKQCADLLDKGMKGWK